MLHLIPVKESYGMKSLLSNLNSKTVVISLNIFDDFKFEVLAEVVMKVFCLVGCNVVQTI
jgi:hypothetical protein